MPLSVNGSPAVPPGAAVGTSTAGLRRRTWLIGGLTGAGALLVGWSVLPPRSRLGTADTQPVREGEVGLNGWIKIAADGGVLLAMPRSEMGQGVHTALAMLVAEELDVAPAQVRLAPAGADSLYGNVAMFVASLPFHPADVATTTDASARPRSVEISEWMVAKLARELGINVTGGSSSVADAWEPLRLAAATARAQLLGAASLQWRQPAGELQVSDGIVSHPSGPRAHYGVLASAAAATPPGPVTLKARSDWRVIGTPAARLDSAAKSNGSAVFGIDVRLPGLLYAAVRHCPMLGGAPGRVDSSAALALPGVERVVRLGPAGGATAALAVVARSSWHALRGAAALDIEWNAPPLGRLDSAAIAAALEQTARDAVASGAGHVFHRRGDAPQAAAAAARRLQAVYTAPFLAHAALEPTNCTARVADGRVEVWAPTQVPGLARALAAQVAGVDAGAVTVHVSYLGGSFGRRLEVDMVGQAVRVALETGGRPVQLLWSREEDTTHDFYRPAAAAVLQASFDAQGQVTGLAITSAGDAVTPRWIERALPQFAGPVEAPDKTASEGLFDLPYGFVNQRIAHVATHSGVPVGFWRSVGHSHNAFFSECFIDEVALAGGQDPLAFRLGWLGSAPRHAAVLRLAAAKAGWGNAPPAGRARGLALHESFGSIVAQVVEVGLESGRPRVQRVVCAADVGTVVNPAIVARQLEGAIIFGLSAALYGRIDIEAGVVRQRNFDEMPLLRLADTPAIETHLLPSTRPPGGVGEPGVPPAAPALANALFALTGRRLRSLPLTL